MICQVMICDADGEISLEVRHTPHQEILIKRYDHAEIGLDYEEARELIAALTTIMAAVERHP